MQDRKFAEILNDLLAVDPAPQAVFADASLPTLDGMAHWHIEIPLSFKPRSPYPGPKRPKPPSPAIRPNPVLAWADLSPVEQAAARQLLQLAHRPTPQTLDEQKVRRAFRRLASQYHPDAHLDASPEKIRKLSEDFGQAHEAYQILRSAFRRQAQGVKKAA